MGWENIGGDGGMRSMRSQDQMHLIRSLDPSIQFEHVPTCPGAVRAEVVSAVSDILPHGVFDPPTIAHVVSVLDLMRIDNFPFHTWELLDSAVCQRLREAVPAVPSRRAPAPQRRRRPVVAAVGVPPVPVTSQRS